MSKIGSAIAVACIILLHCADATAAPTSCAAAVERAEQQIFHWPRGFSPVGLRQTAMLHLRAAVSAAASGKEQLCWEHLALASYKGD